MFAYFRTALSSVICLVLMSLMLAQYEHCSRKKSPVTSNRNAAENKDKEADNSAKPTPEVDTGGVKKAGEFNGDLRDLPNTAPPDQERPRREDPPDKPRPAPTPAVKPTNE